MIQDILNNKEAIIYNASSLLFLLSLVGSSVLFSEKYISFKYWICLAGCGTSFIIHHGHVDFTGQETTYNKLLPIQCEHGYEVTGEGHITCLASGNWSNDTHCIPTCKVHVLR